MNASTICNVRNNDSTLGVRSTTSSALTMPWAVALRQPAIDPVRAAFPLRHRRSNTRPIVRFAKSMKKAGSDSRQGAYALVRPSAATPSEFVQPLETELGRCTSAIRESERLISLPQILYHETVTHVSEQSITYPSGLYTKEGRDATTLRTGWSLVARDRKPHHPSSFAGTPPYMVTSRLASEFFSL